MAIRPSVYIGLGGTGIKAIAQTKKLYEEEFGGKIPPEVAFLGIDFDNKQASDKSLPTDVSGDYLQLVSAVNPAEHYRVGHDQNNQFNWMFSGNSSFIDKNIMNGAKQVRTTGRLYTEIVLNQIKARIQVCYNKVQSIAKARGFNQPVDIHLAMSVAGGSGSGSFLTVAMLIDQMFHSDVNMYGYAVLHGVFRTMDPMGTKTPRVITNAYSAIMDLDYFMHASNDNPIEVSLGPVKHVMRDPIFKEFYVIDNVTENGKVVETCAQLCEVIGTCLYVSGNELGNNKDSLASNIGWSSGGNFNIQTKKGWVYGLGACQVVYRGDLLAETYSYKAARELIRKMTLTSADVAQKALAWTETACIREDGDTYNMLIDSILSPAKLASIPMPLLDVKSSDAANQGLVNKVLDEFIPEMPGADEMKRRSDDLCEQLRAKVNSFLSQENGIGDSLEFLASLKKRCLGYKQEMSEEMAVFTKKAEERKQLLDAKGWKEYEANKHTGLFTRNKDEKNQELLEDLVGRPVQEIRKNRHEAKRREEAYNVFAVLISAIDVLEDKITQIQNRLKALSTGYETELEKRQKETTSSLVFEYDLSYNDRVNMAVNSDEILVPEFIKSLDADLYEVSVDDLDQKLIAYTSGLSKAQEYREKLIMDVVDSLSDADYETLKNEIYEKSSLLLRLDGRGQQIGGYPARDKMVSNYMIAHYGQENTLSRFEQDQYFLQNVVSKEWAKSTSDVMKQKIIFYRVDGAIIPYCIGAFDEFTVKTEYEDRVVAAMASGSTTFNPHFDAEIFADMKKNDFKLKPEMKNEAMFYWVCGQLFGWTEIMEEEREMKKDEKGNVLSEDKDKGKLEGHSKYIACIKAKYYYWDDEALAGKNEKWVSLDNTSRRDTAFNYFKTVVLPQKKELFNTLIKQEFNKNGQQYWHGKIDSKTKEGLEAYINKVVCSNKSSVTYFSSESGEIKLIQQEFDFLSKNLYNALVSLK